MATPYAFVTLVSSDSYLPGALALVAALKEVHSKPPVSPEVDFQTVCLVTPETVDVSTIKRLRQSFDLVIGVEVIEQRDLKGLQLLGRLDLNSVLTKLHVFRLTQYSKIIFLDADVLPIRPLSHLFTLPHEFAAVPDVGWPDIFNSGVLVLSPGEEKFNELTELNKTQGSWDGGDQGLLNEWRGDNWHRLSFTYNTTPTAAYTYAPAYERFGSKISAIHFIGPNKPWKFLPYRAPGTTTSERPNLGPNQTYDYSNLLDRWYDVYDRNYRTSTPSPRQDFEIRRYASAWDQETTFGAEMPTFTGEAPPGSTMGLSELKRVATEGINSLSLTATERPPDGEYRSLPLEGRVDLMRPKPEPKPESVPEQAGGQQDDNSRTPTMHTAQPVTPIRQTFMQTLPTPGPNELPPTPYLRGLSLPSTPTVAPFYRNTGQDQAQQPSPHGGLGLVYQPSASGGSPSHGPSQSQAHQGWPSLQAPSSPTPAPSSVQQLSGSRTGHTHPHIQYIPPAQPQQQQHQQSQSQQPYHHHHHHSYHVHRSQDTTQSHSHSPQSQLVHNFIRHSPLQTRPSSGQSSPSQAEGGGIPLHHWPGSPRGSPPHHRRSSKHGSPIQLRSGHSSPVHRFHGAPSQHVHQPQQVHQLQHVHQPQPRQPQNEPQPQQQPQSPPVQYYPREQLRSPSPPKVSWNPAFEPPPREPPPPSVFPTDTYFPNIWDQEPNQRHDATHQTFSPEPSTPNVNKPDVFFHPPPAPVIPEQLVREGRYANVLGLANSPETQSELTQVPTPDRNKVKSIFPWEEKPRHVPRRVFPASEAPPPSVKFIEEEKPKPSPKAVERPPLSVQTPLSPIGLPSSLTMTYTNAWDVDPSIQRYASKLVRPNSLTAQLSAPPAPMSRDHGWKMLNKQRERERQERQDASSMDGDDEDEGDDEESGVSDGESRRRRSRAGSTVTAAPSRGGKTYKMRGVQTETPQMKSKSVQVTVLRDDGGRARTDSGSSTKTYRNAGSGSGNFKREWSTSGLLPAPILHEGRLEYEGEPEQMSSTPNVSTSLRSVLPFPSLSTPTGLRSPQTLGSPRAYSPPKGGTPVASPSPPKPSSPVVAPARPPTLRRGSTTSSSSKSGSPQLVHSPRSVPSPRRVSLSTPPQKPGSPITGTSASRVQTTPPQRGLPKLSSPFSPQLQRSVSMDTTATLSPATSASLITPENTPIIPARKGGRVFDPARGIDIFKRSSEEVLSRFLRMGSFEEEEARRREHV